MREDNERRGILGRAPEIAGRTNAFLREKARAGARAATGAAQSFGAPFANLTGNFQNVLKGNFPITQQYGNVNPRLYGGVTPGARHQGVDIGTPAGTPVFSPFAGQARVGQDPGGYGSYVEVYDPTTGTSVRMGHLSQIAQGLMAVGSIPKGQQLGLTGGVPGTRGSGRTTGAHLDVSARRRGQNINPFTLEAFRNVRG